MVHPIPWQGMLALCHYLYGSNRNIDKAT